MTPPSGFIDQNVRKKFAKISKSNGMREAVTGIGLSGVAVVTLPRLADCEQPNVDYTVANKKLNRGCLFSIIHK